MEGELMKAPSRYVRVHYGDKVVFTDGKRGKRGRDVLAVWRRSQGLWKDHPVFHGMAAKEVIEWLRGEDSDI
jgi:hypothetical protein